jgi:hypothetical protein
VSSPSTSQSPPLPPSERLSPGSPINWVTWPRPDPRRSKRGEVRIGGRPFRGRMYRTTPRFRVSRGSGPSAAVFGGRVVAILTLVCSDVASLGVLLGVIIGWTLIMTLLGPENVSPLPLRTRPDPPSSTTSELSSIHDRSTEAASNKPLPPEKERARCATKIWSRTIGSYRTTTPKQARLMTSRPRATWSMSRRGLYNGL